MPKRNLPTNKNVELGPLKERVDRIAERDTVHKTASAVIRAAVEAYCAAWDLAHPECPSHG